MKLYTYVPQTADVTKNGLLSVSKVPKELEKYAKRANSDNPKQIIEWLEKTFPGRSRAISVLTEPVFWQGNDSMLKDWIDSKILVQIDYQALLLSGLVESVWKKESSDPDGLNEKIVQIMPEKIDFSPLPWHLCCNSKGIFFSAIRHYFLVLQNGIIPPEYLRFQKS